ncbi:MAG: HEAT repeat domain-containing protein [Planctomycetota bacterium]
MAHPRPVPVRHLLSLVLLLLTAGILGCPTPRPHLDRYQTLRLNGLQGADVEAQVVMAIERAQGPELEFHIRTLEMIGTKKSATLIELIRDTPGADQKVRAAAAEALSRINAREAPDLLAERKRYFAELEKSVGDIRLDALRRTEAVMELAYFGEETAEVTARAIGNWYSDAKADVRYRAYALRIAYNIPSPAALDALAGFAGDVDWFSDEVLYILKFARERFAGRYRDVLRDDLKKPQLKLGAALVLGADGDDAVIPYVKDWLDSKLEPELVLALQILQNVKDPRVLEISIKFLDRRQPAVLKAALNALGTNYAPPTEPGGESRAYKLIAERVKNWPDDARRQALELLSANKETGARELYYQLATGDRDPDVRRLAVQLRGTAEETISAAKDRALLKVLENDSDPATVEETVKTLGTLYATTWVGDGPACDALLRLATRTRGNALWNIARNAGLELLGNWGRFDDARKVEALATYGDHRMLHARWALASANGNAPDNFTAVPEYAAVEEILLRHQKEFADLARVFNPSASEAERAFILHWVHLADGPVARGIWDKVVNGGRTAAADLRFFQPFSLPRDPYWLEMFNLLAKALDSADGRVADAAFKALQTRYLVRNEDGTFRHGEQLRTIFNEGDTRGFVRVLTPIFMKIVEGNASADRQDFMLGVIRDGVLPGEEVARLARRLFEVSLSNARPELAKVFLAQLQKDITGEKFVDVLVPVMVHALAHPDASVRGMVADIIRKHFDKIRTVRSQVSQMVQKACQSDDAKLRDAGRGALEQMARWASGDGVSASDLQLVREALNSILSPLAGDPRRETREAAASAVGAMAGLGANKRERDTPFFREMQRIGQTFAQRDDDRNDALVMRPVAQFFAAIGDDSAVRSILIGLLGNRDLTVRIYALEGLSRQVAADLIPPLQQWLRGENEASARERGLTLYGDAGVKGNDLDAAVWLMTRYPHRRPADTAIATRILDAWSTSQRNPRQREQRFLELCRSEGEEVYPLLLPALQTVASAESLPLLQGVVEAAGPGPRALAAGVLARIPDNLKADALIDRLINDEKEPVRLAAIMAAGEVGRFKSMAGLLEREARMGDKLTQREALAIRAAVSGIVKRMSETLSAGDQILELLQLVESAKRGQQKAWFLDRIAEVEHPSRSGALQQYINDRDDEVRLAAVRNLLRVDGEPSLAQMKDRATDSSKPIRMALADFCATHDGREVRRMLEVLVKDNDEDIRLRALDALTRDTSDPSVLAVLRRVLQSERDTSWKMRRNAVDKLANFRVAGTLELMYGVADDEAWQVRESALRGLVHIIQEPADLIPDETRIEAIATTGLGDSAPEVKMQALELVEVGRFVSLLPTVKRLSEDRDRAVRVKARRVEEALSH